jgi:hypothetical protein
MQTTGYGWLADPIAVHGQRIEGYPSAHSTGRALSTPIYPGTLAIYDNSVASEPRAIIAPSSSADVTTLLRVVGLVRWDPTYPEPPYRLHALVPVMRKGRIAIVAETALAAETNPFVRFTVGAVGTLLGSLRNDADGGNAVAAPYLTVIVGAAVGKPAIVEITL